MRNWFVELFEKIAQWLKKEDAAEDFYTIDNTIKELAKTHEDECPISYLDIEIAEDIDDDLSAPHRMDLALTYDCDNDCEHCNVLK